MRESEKVEIGERLRLFRESKKLSQAQMAATLEGTARGLQDNELGRSLPNSKILIGLIGIGLNVNWLLTEEGPMLLADVAPTASELAMPVDGDLLATVMDAIDEIAAVRRLKLTNSKRAKLTTLLYQYYLVNKAEDQTKAYLSQLMELVNT